MKEMIPRPAHQLSLFKLLQRQMLMDKKKMVLLVVGLLYYHLFISSMNVEIETSEPHFFFFFNGTSEPH